MAFKQFPCHLKKTWKLNFAMIKENRKYGNFAKKKKKIFKQLYNLRAGG